MTIYQLECFIAVAEELNFSAAAERLFTTQPAITYQINALEKETGLHLFERTTRRTKLTAAGQSFYLDMVQMTSFGRQALKKAQDIQDADRSRLTVGLRQLFDYGTFSSILAEFQHQFPNACVDVVPQDNSYLLAYFNGSTDSAIAAYNAGMGNVDGWAQQSTSLHNAITFPETQAYLIRVNNAWVRYKTLYPDRFV